MALWPNKGEPDPRPRSAAAYQRVTAVAPKNPTVPEHAPRASLRLPIVPTAQRSVSHAEARRCRPDPQCLERRCEPRVLRRGVRLRRLVALGPSADVRRCAHGGGEVQFCQDGQGQRGTWLSVWVDDVDALYRRLRDAGADIRQEPTTFEWGVRELNVADPDGHRIRFSMATELPSDGREFPAEPDAAWTGCTQQGRGSCVGSTGPEPSVRASRGHMAAQSGRVDARLCTA